MGKTQLVCHVKSFIFMEVDNFVSQQLSRITSQKYVFKIT